MCHLDSSVGCKYVNDARNPVMWTAKKDVEEDGSIRSAAERLPVALLRCEPQFCPKETSTRRRRRAPQDKTVPDHQKHRIQRHEITHVDRVKSTHLVLNIPRLTRRSAPVFTALRSFVELGKFIKTTMNNFLKFSVTGAQGALYQELYIVAHCLPDPPGHLDHFSSNGYDTIKMVLSGASQTKCLQLKDRVRRCNEFSIRFSVYIQHHISQKIQVTLTPHSTYPSLTTALCTGKN